MLRIGKFVLGAVLLFVLVGLFVWPGWCRYEYYQHYEVSGAIPTLPSPYGFVPGSQVYPGDGTPALTIHGWSPHKLRRVDRLTGRVHRYESGIWLTIEEGR